MTVSATSEIALRYAVDAGSSKSARAEYRLLQCPESMLQDVERAISEGRKIDLAFVGSPDDELVLVTSCETIGIKEVQYSNSLLLCREDGAGDEDSWEVKAKMSSVLESTLCAPKLERLDVLLAGWEYNGDEEFQSSPIGKRQKIPNGHSSSRGYSHADLLNVIQASERELRIGLEERRAVLIQDKYHTLASEYLLPLLHSIILNLQTLSWSTGQPLHCDKLLKAMDDIQFSPSVVNQVLAWITRRIDDSQSALNELALVRLIGLESLKRLRSGQRHDLAEFITEWKAQAGSELAQKCDLSLLEGYYLLYPEPVPPTTTTTTNRSGPRTMKGAATASSPSANAISALAHHSLPTEPSARFAALFNIRTVWRDTDIRPFLYDIIPVTATTSAQERLDRLEKESERLLTRYARRQRTAATGPSWFTTRSGTMTTRR